MDCSEQAELEFESNVIAIPTQDGRVVELSVPPQDDETDDLHESTDDLHPFKRLVLVTKKDREIDAVSERAVQNLLTYGLASDRSQAIAMLLVSDSQEALC